MVQSRLDHLPEELGGLALPTASDRGVWDGLPDSVRRALILRGEECLGLEWPRLTCGDYLAFTRTGERAAFEKKYFARRKALCALALAECAEHAGRFLSPLADGIWSVCEESGWQLPSHNNYVRDTTPLPLPDVDRPVPDLFACETAATLSLIRALLGVELDGAAPILCRRIVSEVDKRVVSPYLHHHFWWMGDGDEPMCNWTAWCTQNMLLTVFTCPCPQAVKQAVVRQAAYSLDCFLKDCGDDGCCEEGALYYRHAGLALWGALEVLDRVSGGCFAPLFGTEKVRNIAAYIVNVHVEGDYYLNYADCSPKPGPCGAREYLFGLRTGQDALCSLACAGAARRPSRDLPEDSALFDRLLDALCSRALLTPHPAVSPPSCVFYPSTGLWIARDETWCVSVRAGHNGGSHGHCDAGSLIVYRRGRPLLIDIGIESYTAKTFSPRRGEIWTIRSDWHNLPAINSAVQGMGAQYGASQVEMKAEQASPRISMELASAYPVPAGTFSYRRTVSLRAGRLTVEDCFTGDGEAVLSLLFQDEPVWQDGTLELGWGGIRISGGGVPAIEAVSISDPQLRQSWPDTLYRALIPVDGLLVMEFYGETAPHRTR